MKNGEESMQDEPTLLDCAHSIIESVPQLARLMRQDLRLHSAGTFTEPQFRVMAHLFREGKKCLSGLADHLGVSLPTISKLTQGLEARGLVSRERDPEDRRRVLLTLTEEGCTAYAALLRRTENHMVDWIHTFDLDERKQVIGAFNLLIEAFEHVELPDSYDYEEVLPDESPD